MKAGGELEGVDIQCQPMHWQEERLREFDDTIDRFIVIAQQNLFGAAPVQPIIGPALDQYICAAYAKAWGVNFHFHVWTLSAQVSREGASILSRQYCRKGMRVSSSVLSSGGSARFETFQDGLETKFHAQVRALVKVADECDLLFGQNVSIVNHPDAYCEVCPFSLHALKSMIAESHANRLERDTLPSGRSAILTRL